MIVGKTSKFMHPGSLAHSCNNFLSRYLPLGAVILFLVSRRESGFVTPLRSTPASQSSMLVKLCTGNKDESIIQTSL